MSKNTNTYISMLFFFAGILVIAVASIFQDENNALKSANNIEGAIQSVVAKQKNKEESKKVNIKLSFIGDSLLASFKGEKYPENFQDLLETHDYSFPFKNVKYIFEQDDFTIANGENVFTDKNLLPTIKNYTPAFWYYSKMKYANIYKESSIEVVSIMNNHTYDYNYDGYLDTIKALKNAGVTYGGEDPVILEKDGIKIGLICANLFHSFQSDEIVNQIKSIKDKVTYIIVYFHGGTEYLFSPPAEIKKYSHAFVDAGADLVLGAHPHVLQPIEVYKNKKIVYSLGSFLFGGTTTLINRTIIYQVNLEFNRESNSYIETDKVIPCYLYSTNYGYEKWLPKVIENSDEKQKVLDFMSWLRDKPY